MNNKPLIIDLFCGAGGLSHGFESAGFETVLAIDHWDDAIKTFNFNNTSNVGISMDIHDLTNEFLFKKLDDRRVTGIVGGPPCQGFSTVGTRDINDERNHLYMEYYRIVKEILPTFFVIENVKGLLTLSKGMFKNDIMERFGSLGYTIQTPKILNSVDYGVPQFRERVFFVGIRNDKTYEYPKTSNRKISSSEALSDLPSLDKIKDHKESYGYDISPQNQYQKTMRKNSQVITNHNYTNHQQKTIDIISMVPDGGGIKDLPPEFWNIRKYNKAFQRMNSKFPAHTIDTGHRNYFHYSENRVPSVRESARLQSFPDDFQFLGTKTSQYMQVGNAVPPLLAKHVAESIYNLL